MKRTFFYFLVLLFYNVCLANDFQSFSSPNKNITGKIEQKGDGIKATIEYCGQTVIPEIRFGIQVQELFLSDTLKWLGVSETALVEDQYIALHGKRRSCHNLGNTFVLSLENVRKQRLDIEFRVYNDGICFRYVLPETEMDSLRFLNEYTSYRISEDAERWIQKYVTHYEGDFIYETKDVSQGEWGYPALFHYNDCWTLITEADIDRNYCATHLKNTEDSELYQIAFPHQEEGNGMGEVFPTAKTPWTSPWRVMIMGELKDIVASTLVEDVSRPCTLTDTDWIQPGSASWVYWAYNHGTKDYKICCDYVDLAAAMRWKYVLFDWEWDQMQNGGNLEDAARYACSKGIKPLLWYNSGGQHNQVPCTPKDRLITREKRYEEFEKLKKMGFCGIKVDFFESDKQHMMNYYLDILEDAAKFELMVDFHGCTLPRGWSRTYPHLMSMEAVYGAEQYNNSSFMTDAGARLNCIYPFTRNVVGPMDYTPVAFTNSQHPHHTTNAHELALAVMFESGIQHWADRPEGFYQLPDDAKDFMSRVPVAWDETLLVDGFPGKYVILARQKDDTWYLAGINGTQQAEDKTIKLDFLSDNKTYRMTSFSDGQDSAQITVTTDERVDCNSSLSVKWLPQGGFVAYFKCTDY